MIKWLNLHVLYPFINTYTLAVTEPKSDRVLSCSFVFPYSFAETVLLHVNDLFLSHQIDYDATCLSPSVTLLCAQ